MSDLKSTDLSGFSRKELEKIIQEQQRMIATIRDTCEEAKKKLIKKEKTIAQFKENEEVWKNLATIDKLTKVHNLLGGEHAFNDTISEALRQNHDKGADKHSFVFFLFIDIDDFKQYNTIHGYDTADRVLHSVAQAVDQNLHRKPTDIAYRIGGDEFGGYGIVEDVASAKKIAQRTLASISSSIVLDSNGCPLPNVGASIGLVCLYPEELKDLSPADALKKLRSIAFKGLQKAKDTGKNKVVFCGAKNGLLSSLAPSFKTQRTNNSFERHTL